MHKTNAVYFSISDLGAFETILAGAYDRVGISAPVDTSELLIQKVDLAANVLDHIAHQL